MATISIPQTATVEQAAHYAVSGRRVRPEQIDELARRLVAAYDPVRVVVFGSRARGTNRPDSDLDVAVIVDDGARTGSTGWDREGLELRVSVDVLVFPLSQHRRLACSVESVNYAIAHEGVVLHEREPRLEPFYLTVSAEELVSAKTESLNILLKNAALDELTLNLDGVPHEIAGFHGQQALEKLIKVWLGAADIVPLHTHELPDLEKQLVGGGLQLPPLGVDLVQVTKYAVTWRYFDLPDQERVDLDALRLAVRTLRAHVLVEALAMGLELGPK